MNFSDLTKQFESQQVDPEAFGHEQHLLVAFEMLHQYDFMEAATKYADGIRSMTNHAGVPEKFNMTITLAFLSLIAERIHTYEQKDFGQFLEKNPDLMSPALLNKWYSKEQLNSELARTHFLLPALAA